MSSVAKTLVIEISADDKLISIIQPHIYLTNKTKAIANIVRLITLIAGGTTKSNACALTGTSYANLKRWCREEWWDQAVEIVKERLDMALDDSYTAVIHKSTNAVIDRLDEGDVVLTKTGAQVRKPVSARDAMLIAGIAHDKRALLRGRPTTITESVSEGERLRQLAEKFKTIGEGRMFDSEGELLDG